MEKRKRYIDLFSGCGGLSLGLCNSGWSGYFAVERNRDAFETLKYNLIESRRHFKRPKWLECKNIDIKVIISEERKNLQELKGKILLIVGGLLVRVFLWLEKERPMI